MLACPTPSRKRPPPSRLLSRPTGRQFSAGVAACLGVQCPNSPQFTCSAKPRLPVRGVNDIMEPLVHPVPCAEQFYLPPPPGYRAKLRLSWQDTYERPRLGPPRELGAFQHINRIVGDSHAPILDPKYREESKIVDYKEPEVGRGLANEYLADMGTRRQKWSRAFDEVRSFYSCFTHITYSSRSFLGWPFWRPFVPWSRNANRLEASNYVFCIM